VEVEIVPVKDAASAEIIAELPAAAEESITKEETV